MVGDKISRMTVAGGFSLLSAFGGRHVRTLGCWMRSNLSQNIESSVIRRPPTSEVRFGAGESMAKFLQRPDI